MNTTTTPALELDGLRKSFGKTEIIRGVDLAVSFLSCGFHYPLSTYEGFFSNVLAGGGAMIVDVRQTQGSEKDAELQEYGDTREISLFNKRRRVLVN